MKTKDVTLLCGDCLDVEYIKLSERRINENNQNET